MTVHDVLIIGAGPAGLGVAYHLREQGLDIKVLEAEPEVGGRTKSVRLPGGMANTGAQFAYRSTPSEEMVAELGLETVPFQPTTYGISIDGVTSIGSDNAEVVAGLPLDDDERASLLKVLDDAVDEYRKSTSGGAFNERADAIAEESVAERLRQLSPRVSQIVGTAILGGSVGKPEQLLAKYAMRYFASYPAHETENRLLILDGMQQIPLTMAKALPGNAIDLSTRASKVEQEPDGGYAVTTIGPAGPLTYRAKQVVVAVPAPLVAGLVPELPDSKLEALQIAETPGSTTMTVAADVTGVESHRDWAFVTTVGRRFECIINPAPGGWRSADAPGIVHFTCYGNGDGYQPQAMHDPAEQAAWVADFLAVAPELEGRIVGYHIESWEHCFALISPARAAVVDELQRPVGGIHFAGDWTSASAGTHGALGEAARVAQAVLEHG